MNFNIKDTVIKLLQQHPHLRDSDNRLIANVWYQESKTISTVNDFLKAYAEGTLTNAESIRRMRQKIQEENPQLRGENYIARHAHQQPVKQELGY